MRFILSGFCVLVSAIFAVSCGGGSGHVSSGLKIFFTYEQHVGNFADDPMLTGSNAIEKADDFCMKSDMRPNDAEYKALLVDGVNRDAATLTDWVLLPNTMYYRWYEDIPIGMTTPDAIFNVYYENLLNSTEDCDIWNEVCETGNGWKAWTGIGDTLDFTTGEDTCQGWTSVEGEGIVGRIGNPANSEVFSLRPNSCGVAIRLYCVEQPGG